MSLTISAVELYSYGAWDINAKKRNACTITTGAEKTAADPASAGPARRGADSPLSYTPAARARGSA